MNNDKVDEIKAVIIKILKDLDIFSEVYDVETEAFKGYPAAIVMANGTPSSEIYTTTKRMWTFKFKIEVWYGFENETKQKQAQDAVDQVVFKVQQTLSNSKELKKVIHIFENIEVEAKDTSTGAQGNTVIQNVFIDLQVLM